MITRKIPIDWKKEGELDSRLIYSEYLVTNGLGGYSSLSLSGTTTRKYHGILVSALPAPLGRYVMLNYLEDQVLIKQNQRINLSQEEFIDQKPWGDKVLKEFRLEDGLPVWTYAFDGYVLEKRIFMAYRQNTVVITYHLLEGTEGLELSLKPFFHFRHHEASVSTPMQEHYEFKNGNNRSEIFLDNLPSLKILLPHGAHFIEEKEILKNIHYRIESERGYDSIGDLKSYGLFDLKLEPHQKVAFIASTESWENMEAISPSESLAAEKERRKYLLLESQRVYSFLSTEHFAQELVFAADQFIITPISRAADVAWTHAIGEEPRTVIAGYHWFTDWGRDTMIALEGLTLLTGRFQDASYILKMFAHHLRDGLIPNMFPDGQNQGVYYTVDATFWFLHALDRYLYYTKDEALIISLLPKIKEIINFHIQGTNFGIRMDPLDGLLTQGQDGYALTWMDAKVGDLVVTPRRGKTVEVNALWYNALKIASEWIAKYEGKQEAEKHEKIAEQCFQSFNQKFWYADKNYLYDIIEGEIGNDPACRPNQIFAFSLKYPILKPERWESVLEMVRKELLTRVGLRTLSPDHPNYKISYSGNLFLRDSAYHQGTTWAWLIGPFVDAWVRVYPDKLREIRKILEGFDEHLNEGCIGSINEIFDATEPYTHRGCVAQAWSISEVLRAWMKVSKKTIKSQNLSTKAS